MTSTFTPISYDTFTVSSTTAVLVGADQDNQKKIINAAGGTLYYKSSSDVSSSSNDGNLTAGQSRVFTAPVWVIASTSVNALVEPLGTISVPSANSVPTQAGTWQPIAATSGTDTACSNGTAYVGSIFVPNTKTVTGIQFLIGSVGGTDKVIASLHNYATGAPIANSDTAGTTVGTAANGQQVAFTAPVTVSGPAHYWVALTFNGTTAKFRSVPAHCQNGSGVLGNGVTQTFGTVAAFTPPTTFTADKVPVASIY